MARGLGGGGVDAGAAERGVRGVDALEGDHERGALRLEVVGSAGFHRTPNRAVVALAAAVVPAAFPVVPLAPELVLAPTTAAPLVPHHGRRASQQPHPPRIAIARYFYKSVTCVVVGECADEFNSGLHALVAKPHSKKD